MKALSRLIVALFAAVTAFAMTAPSWAHEGHDHDKPPPLTLPIAPRVISVTPDYELVGVLSGEERLTIFLHAFATGEPVPDATLEVSADGQTTPATAAGAGVFEVSAPWIAKPGAYDITFNLTLPSGLDVMVGRFERPSKAAVVPAPPSVNAWLEERQTMIAAGAGALMAGLLIGLLFTGRRRGGEPAPRPGIAPTETEPVEATTSVRKLRRGPAVILVFLAAAGLADRALAVDIPKSAPPEIPATMATDAPERLGDGSLFVPKATQHLLSLRTVLTAATDAPRAVQSLGRVIPDPNTFGRVQATQAGRFETASAGIPHLGQRVTKGDVLGGILPTATSLDAAEHTNELVALDAAIEVARKKYDRLAKYQGVVRQRDIEEAKADLDGLVQRRTNHAPALRVMEELLAPSSGVISAASVVPGQVVEARETLFEIVDPARLWVEAIAYDSAIIDSMSAAYAVTGKGETLPLSFIGRGVALREQAIPLNFRLEKTSEDLGVGQPVTVYLHASTKVEGFVLPASSVVRGQNGLPVVWVKIEPERFEPQVIAYEKLDGERVVVSAGLKPDQRVVTDGVTLINQIR